MVLARIGLLGLVVAFVGSLIQSGPQVGEEAWEQGVRSAAQLSALRTFTGGVLGTLGTVCALAGVVATHRRLLPAGRPVATVASVGFGAWLVLYAGWHAGRPLLTHLHRVAELPLDARLYTDGLTYLNVHRSFAGVGLFFGSVFFFFTVAFRPTEYPPWVAALTPLFLVPVVRLTPMLPSGVAGPVLFGGLDLILLPLFAVTSALRPTGRTPLRPPSAGRGEAPR